MSKPYAVVTRAAEMDYMQDAVSLPRSYEQPGWDSRPDVASIRQAVFDNLIELDKHTYFTRELHHRPVIIKPNLVTVFHNLGMREPDYPETTDPRVLDALILFLQQFTSNIVIAESSGRGMPTRASFRIAQLHRLACRRKVQLIALEEPPDDANLLPKARVKKEITLPRLMSQVVEGEAFYISVPKMKTNLYTGVTLGFKNAMGLLTYNLRQRNHTYDINQKLVDLLHLIQPHLVVIDGIVGGEGNCPAPVMPVQSRMIVSGNNVVETDRVATRLMGMDPAQIPLFLLADEDGFGDAEVEVLGDLTPTPYQPADPSLWGSWMQTHFPNVKVLIGHSIGGAPQPDAEGYLTADNLAAMEMVCRGGCLATTRYAFDMLFHEGHRTDFHMMVIIGNGVMVNGQIVYYEQSGQPVTIEEIHSVREPKLAVGTCANHLAGMVDAYASGCMPMPNTPHMLVHQLGGTSCRVMSLRNRWLLPALWDTLCLCESRKAVLRRGERLDLPMPTSPDHLTPRAFSPEETQQAWVKEEFPHLTEAEIRAACRDENRSILATFKP